MTISYPLSLPSVEGAVSMDLEITPNVGMLESEFALGQQTYAWPTERWFIQFACPPMSRADAEQWVGGFLVALNGMEGSFLAGQFGYTTPQGTWSGGSPLVNGASQTGKTLAIDGLAAGATGKAGDLFQLGSGSSSRLHKLTKDFTANGSGQATLDFTPRIRTSPADNAAITLASPKGLFMLNSNQGKWSINTAMLYGVSFVAFEDLRGL